MKDLTKIKTPLGLLKPKVMKAMRAHGGPYRKYVGGGLWAFTADPDWSDEMMILRLPDEPDHGAIDYKPITLTTVVGYTHPHPIFAAVKEWQDARKAYDGVMSLGGKIAADKRMFAAEGALAAIKVPS